MCASLASGHVPTELGFGVGLELLRGLFSVTQHLGIEGTWNPSPAPPSAECKRSQDWLKAMQ